MKASVNAVELIQRWESLELKAYKDTGGVLTIGYGHTGEGVNLLEITEEQATEFLQIDMAWAVSTVRRLVKVPLTQNQFDALVSFVFNIGESQFRRSTLLKMLNDGLYDGASRQFTRWVYDNGKELDGLENRRIAEQQLFLTHEQVELKDKKVGILARLKGCIDKTCNTA